MRISDMVYASPTNAVIHCISAKLLGCIMYSNVLDVIIITIIIQCDNSKSLVDMLPIILPLGHDVCDSCDAPLVFFVCSARDI